MLENFPKIAPAFKWVYLGEFLNTASRVNP